jgi:NAD(P)H dehydrogenase (quinone)
VRNADHGYREHAQHNPDQAWRMRIQLIYAHPVEGSFCSALRDIVRNTLLQNGHVVCLTDLYGEGFAPALSREERLNYERAGANIASIGPYVERLQWAEGLILVFPTWWYGMPAILKGYFDRVWVPGVAFDLEPAGGGLRRRLDHIQLLAIVTTYGSPWWFIKLRMRDPGKAVLMRGLGRLIRPGSKRLYLAQYGMDRSTSRSRTRFIGRVEQALKTLK